MTRPRSDLPAPVAAALTMLVDASAADEVFSTSMAHDAGLSDEMLDRLVTSGRLRHPIRGWYHLAAPEAKALDLHRRAAIAQVRRRDGRAVASHQSALVVHGIPVLGANLETVHVTHRTSASYRVGRGCVVHRADASTSAVELGPAATAVTAPFAIVQAGLVNGPLTTLVAGDYALHAQLTSPDALARAAAAYRRAAGIAAVTRILPYLSELAESPAESLAREAVRRLGYPVVAQRWVEADPGRADAGRRDRASGQNYRVDLVIEGTPVVLEVHGRVKYEVRCEDDNDPAETIMAEKARHICLERAGYRVQRLTWREIITPAGELRLGNIRTLIEKKLRRDSA